MVVKLKNAFTMIELIFAIIVIAISVVSLPTMIQATSSGVEKNLEAQEAIFKAIVLTKSAIGTNDFTTLDNVAVTTKTSIQNDVGLIDYKFNQKYTLTVAAGATFNGDTNASIKKVTTNIFNQNDQLIASFSAYKFNY